MATTDTTTAPADTRWMLVVKAPTDKSWLCADSSAGPKEWIDERVADCAATYPNLMFKAAAYNPKRALAPYRNRPWDSYEPAEREVNLDELADDEL
jgi:hypothetical protein